MTTISNIKRLAEAGNQVYEDFVKPNIDEEAEKGRFVAIEVESHNYYIGNTPVDAFLLAREKHPDKVFHLVRIGFPGVYEISRLQPTDHEWIS